MLVAMVRQVVAGLSVTLPEQSGDRLLLQRPNRAPRQLVRADPPDSLRSEIVWKRLQREPLKSKVLDEIGAELGAWLLDAPGFQMLEECRQEFESDESRSPRRITLHVPERLAGWPWEAAFGPSLRAPIGVDDNFVLVRTLETFSKEPRQDDISRSIVLVGVELANDNRPSLGTVSEIEAIRQALEPLAEHHIDVHTVAMGTWRRLLERVQVCGSPTVLHFAGHGDGAGDALVFRGDDGDDPAERVVNATKICELLTRNGRQSRLVVLNACRSAAGQDPTLQPFGSIAQRLVKNGVAAVIGHQVPIADAAANEFAAALYASLANGDLPDVAAQTARCKLFSGGVSGAEWPFVVAATCGEPAPIFQRSSPPAPDRARMLHTVAFDEQRKQLEKLIRARRSFVAVVHGPIRAGHRFVLERARADVAESGHAVWKPLPEMRWFIGGDPRLNTTALLGAIAETAGIESRGTNSELEARIVTWIRDCCANGRTLVLDVIDVCTASTPHEAEAIGALVIPLWSSLIERADAGPTILLLAVGYPDGWWSWLRQRRAKKAVARLRKVGTVGNGVMRVVDELQPIRQQDVATFLNELGRPRECAIDLASGLVAFDNEYVLQHLHRLIEARNV
jgi:hypothetical protein